VSIRLGETRRQAPLHKLRKQPFRFPTCEEAMSIEVMQVVASCRIALLPAKVDYWIPLTDGTGARNDVTSTANSSMCIGMHVQFPGSSDLSFNTSGTGVQVHALHAMRRALVYLHIRMLQLLHVIIWKNMQYSSTSRACFMLSYKRSRSTLSVT